MRTLCILLLVTLASVACMKDFKRERPEKDTTGVIPADFEWKTVSDVTASVGIPSIDGVAPEFAIIRIFSTPKIAESSEIAVGVVTPANPSLNTAFTVPAGVNEVYVKTILPDGRSTVQAADISSGRIDLSGESMKSAAPIRLLIADKAAAPKSTSMPTHPTLPEKNQSDFDSRAVISKTPASNDQLGASWASFAAAEYYIPSGVVIEGNIDLNGGFAPHPAPILYVKGKLSLASPQIGGTLAILPGGEVTTTGLLAARGINKAPNPTIYIFPGGKLTADQVNLSCESIVNNGKFVIKGKLDTNGQVTLYNGTEGEISATDFAISNTGKMYNDGKIAVDDFELNSNTTFENCENGAITIGKMRLTNGNSTFFTQKGAASLDALDCQGVLNIQCYTYIKKMTAEGAKINIASGSCLETATSQFNNTQIEMAANSLFITKEYNLDEKGGNSCKNDDSDTAVFRIDAKAVIGTGRQTQFSGKIEVVYDDSNAAPDYQINDQYVKSHFKKGAYLTAKQLTNIPATECNAGKGVIDPTPEEKPDQVVTTGATYTYCFEDGWPWLCDYDLNDVVIPVSIDRRISDDGSKVEFITINWEVKASGAKHRLAMAVQLDKVKSDQIASIETTNSGFSAGPFVDSSIEAGNDYAVIPLFNSINETQSEGATFFNIDKTKPKVATTKHATTIRFTSPVDVNSVLESAMNLFIVVNRGTSGATGRSIEVHLPWFKPTQFGDITNLKTIQPNNPYKYYSPTDPANSGMMWGLMIPGEFRYPAESRDIRNVYTYFRAWAVSGGTTHKEWYQEDVVKTLLY